MEFRLQKKQFQMILAMTTMLFVLIAGCTTQSAEEEAMMEEKSDIMIDDEEVMVEDEVMVEKDSDAMMESTKKTFVITGENFKFMMDEQENPDLEVGVGDTVRIEFTSTSGFHDWVVDEFSAATEKVTAGGSTFVEFVADEAGTFEYYCSVGSHRANGMKGKLVVN